MQPTETPSNQPQSSGCLKTLLIVLATVVVTAGATYWILTQYVFPSRFDPVELSQQEKKVLDKKLAIFQGWDSHSEETSSASSDLEPEKYSEENADRTIELTERELNGLLAENTDMAERLIIDLSDSLASAKLLIPLDPDFPLMGGKTLKITAGLELAYANNKPIVVLKGVSVMGVPVPNAWLGGIKNVDLVREFGGDQGFWQAFAAGVELVSVEEGELLIKLKE